MSAIPFPRIWTPDRRMILPRRPNVATTWRDRLRGIRDRFFPTKLDAQGRFVQAGGRVVGAGGQKAGDTANCGECPCGSGSGGGSCFGCDGSVWPTGGNTIVTIDGVQKCNPDGCSFIRSSSGEFWSNQVSIDINGTYCVPGTPGNCGGTLTIPIDFRFSYEPGVTDCTGTYHGSYDSVTFLIPDVGLEITGFVNVGIGGEGGYAFIGPPMTAPGTCYNGSTQDNTITDCSFTDFPTTSGLYYGGTVTISYTASPC